MRFFWNLGVEIDEESEDSDDDLESPSLQPSVLKRLDEDDLYPFFFFFCIVDSDVINQTLNQNLCVGMYLFFP